jgi:hypothetical protein
LALFGQYDDLMTARNFEMANTDQTSSMLNNVPALEALS